MATVLAYIITHKYAKSGIKGILINIGACSAILFCRMSTNQFAGSYVNGNNSLVKKLSNYGVSSQNHKLCLHYHHAHICTTSNSMDFIWRGITTMLQTNVLAMSTILWASYEYSLAMNTIPWVK